MLHAYHKRLLCERPEIVYQKPLGWLETGATVDCDDGLSDVPEHGEGSVDRVRICYERVLDKPTFRLLRGFKKRAAVNYPVGRPIQ